jgi:hypothetical protein
MADDKWYPQEDILIHEFSHAVMVRQHCVTSRDYDKSQGRQLLENVILNSNCFASLSVSRMQYYCQDRHSVLSARRPFDSPACIVCYRMLGLMAVNIERLLLRLIERRLRLSFTNPDAIWRQMLKSIGLKVSRHVYRTCRSF